MRELFRKLNAALTSGEDAVIVTVVASSGSTPRGSGARMLITAKGRVHGTIGGGLVEYRGEQMAAEILKDRKNVVEHFCLHPSDEGGIGMACGGDVDLFFRYCPAGDKELIALTEHIEECFVRGEQFWLVCNVTVGKTGDMSVFGKVSGSYGAALPENILGQLSGKPQLLEEEGQSYHCEELQKPGKVYIFGGGHVAQALVPVLAGINFRCIVLEDREAFAKPELFPGVEETRIVDMEDLSTVQAELTPDDYVCIMTRGHVNDIKAQAAVMATPVRYIGIIGSAKKQKTVREKMREYGFTDEDFGNVYAPVGLKIGAETPAEIAISIAAQLIMVRAGKDVVGWDGVKK